MLFKWGKSKMSTTEAQLRERSKVIAKTIRSKDKAKQRDEFNADYIKAAELVHRLALSEASYLSQIKYNRYS